MRGDVGLVLFDCDGVLIDSERLAVRVDVRVLADLGWPLSEQEIIDRFVGRSHATFVAAIEEQLGRRLDDGWETKYRPLWDEAFRDLAPVDGIVEALARIDLPSCVASSSSHESLRRKLAKTGLLARFDGRIFSATDVRNGKPAPDLFLHAAARMGVPPNRCVVVEDSVYGVEAGRAAGMRVLAYGGGVIPGPRLVGPGTVVFDDMRRLPGLLGCIDGPGAGG